MTNIDEARLADEVFRQRTEAGLNQEGMARRLHVSRSMIQNIEARRWAGGEPLSPTKMGTLRDVARRLRVPVDAFLADDESTPPRNEQEREYDAMARDALRFKLDREPSEQEVAQWLFQAAVDKARHERNGDR